MRHRYDYLRWRRDRYRTRALLARFAALDQKAGTA